MSNLGYLRGIDGSLRAHMRYAHRHVYCPLDAQNQALRQLLALLEREDPDIACFVEIDQGTGRTTSFNQLEAMVSERYPFFDVENKYGQASRLRGLAFTKGKSNAFIAKRPVTFQKHYFQHGTKRLIYQLDLEGGITLFFAHFSLKRAVRAQQLLQIRTLLSRETGPAIILGDFNILSGFQELDVLLRESDLAVANDAHTPTFTFHRFRKTLDLCICSRALLPRLQLEVIPQPFSDHAALSVEITA